MIPPDMVLAAIILVVGIPLGLAFNLWYVQRWYRKHGRVEDILINLFEKEGE